jgi:hypothetical protein
MKPQELVHWPSYYLVFENTVKSVLSPALNSHPSYAACLFCPSAAHSLLNQAVLNSHLSIQPLFLWLRTDLTVCQYIPMVSILEAASSSWSGIMFKPAIFDIWFWTDFHSITWYWSTCVPSHYFTQHLCNYWRKWPQTPYSCIIFQWAIELKYM